MNPGRCIRASLLFSIIFLMAISGVSAGSLWGKVSDQEWHQGPPANFPDANAAVLFDLCTLSVTIDQIEITRHVRMKVFNKKGAEDIGDVSVDYVKGDALKDLRAQTITPDGKTMKVSSKDIHDKSVGDDRSRVFTFPAMDSGCIVEYSYRNVNERYTYMDPWYFQSGLYTFKSAFTLVLGSGFTYITAFSNVPPQDRAGVKGDLPNPIDINLKLKTFTYTRVNLAPVEEEPLMGARVDFLSALHHQLVSYVDPNTNITFIKNWKDLGEKYQQYLDQFNSGGNLGDIVAKVLIGVTDPAERTRKLYEYVCTTYQTRHEGEATGKANETIGDLCRTGSGSGEDKNLLLCALLNKAGIKAWPVLISTRDHGGFNPEIYQIRQFNYTLAFAQFDSSIVYMDTYSKFCPFGILPPDKLAVGGFLIDGKNSQLVKVLRNEPRSYRLDITDVDVDTVGVARCSTQCSFSGYFAPTYGELRDENTPEEFVKKYFIDKIDKNGTLVSNEFSVDSIGRCKLDAVYTLNNLVRQVDNNLVLKPVGYRYRENPFSSEKRYFPIDFEYAQTYHNIMVIHSRRAVTTATLPPDVNIQIDGASYRRMSQFESGVVRIDAKLTITQPVYAPAQYQQIKDFFESIAKAQQDDIVLTTGG